MENFKFLIFCTLLSVLFSCTKGIEEEIVEEMPLNCFCIEGIVDGEIFQYSKIDAESSPNTYTIASQDTRLQTFSEDFTVGYWGIRLYDVIIEEIELPYKLKPGEGKAVWYDEAMDELVANDSICSNYIPWGCDFVLTTSQAGSEMIITSVEDGVIKGKFSGKANISGIAASYVDTTSYLTITGGRFNLEYEIK